MAQEVERRIGNAEVTGPTPVASFLKPESFIRGSGFLYHGKDLAMLHKEG